MNTTQNKINQANSLTTNRIETIEQLRLNESCPNHPGNKLISFCFTSNKYEEVFLCEQCENYKNHIHVNLSELTQDVEKKKIIKNWPVISKDVLTRIQIALQLTFEDEIELDNEQQSSLRQKQLCLEETYNEFSQQKEFRDVIMSDVYNYEEKSKRLILLINFVKEYQSEIDEEFVSLLHDLESSKNKIELKNNLNNSNNLSEQKQNRIKLNQQDGNYKLQNKITGQQNRKKQIKLKISRLNEQEIYQNDMKMKKINSIFYEISRMPNLNNVNLDLKQTLISLVQIGGAKILISKD